MKKTHLERIYYTVKLFALVRVHSSDHPIAGTILNTSMCLNLNSWRHYFSVTFYNLVRRSVFAISLEREWSKYSPFNSSAMNHAKLIIDWIEKHLRKKSLEFTPEWATLEFDPLLRYAWGVWSFWIPSPKFWWEVEYFLTTFEWGVSNISFPTSQIFLDKCTITFDIIYFTFRQPKSLK